jgi:hypothetical protein
MECECGGCACSFFCGLVSMAFLGSEFGQKFLLKMLIKTETYTQFETTLMNRGYHYTQIVMIAFL